MIMNLLAISYLFLMVVARVTSLRSSNEHIIINHRKTSTRIIGGSVAPPNRYNYYTSLRKIRSDGTTGTHFCGGSLIAPQVVLTAAHCVDEMYSPQIRVLIGRPDFTKESDGQVINVQREVVHPMFTRVLGRAPNYDFALLYLETPVNTTFDDRIQFLQLNQNQNVPQSGDQLTVVGHGYTKVNEFSISQQLKELDKFAISNEECKNITTVTSTGWNDYDSLLTDQMFCADDRPGDGIEEDSCNGDSGGAILMKGDDPNGGSDLSIGVTSWGYGCAVRGYPGVYARVADVYDWIREQLCESENGGVMVPDTFGCSISKAESEEESEVDVVEASSSVSPSVIMPAESPLSARPSATPTETRTTVRPSASSTEIETTMSLPPTSAVSGSGFGTSFPTTASLTITTPPTAESTTVSTEESSIVITSAPTPAPTEESTAILITMTPTASPTEESTIGPSPTPTEEGTILIFSEIAPNPTPSLIVASSPDFTLFPTRFVGDGRLYSTTTTKKPTGYTGTLFPTSSEEV